MHEMSFWREIMLELLNIIFDGTYVTLECRVIDYHDYAPFKVKFDLKKEEVLLNPEIDEMMISDLEKDVLKQYSKKAMWKIIDTYENEYIIPKYECCCWY